MQNKPINDRWHIIVHDFPESARQVLEVFVITGIADGNQVMFATTLTRDRVSRTLVRLISEGLLEPLDRPLARPGQRGQPPRIFWLTKTGAEILRTLGHPGTHECGLKDDLPILHALAMVDVHLAAVKENINLVTDSEIQAGIQRLRPDHRIIWDGQPSILLEVEQAASTEILRRVVESVRNKQEYFKESPPVLPEVRIVVNLPRGRLLEQTYRTWQKAIGIIPDLAFRMFFLPLREFLEHPDWGVERTAAWREVTLVESSELVSKPEVSAPGELLLLTSRQDSLVLAALWQDFLENIEQNKQLFPKPDPEFLYLIRLIYTASHDDSLPPLARAGLPGASIYLLNHYLTLRALRTRLQKAVHSGRGNVRWNPTTIMHRMQVVANIFLAEHGWGTDGTLFVCSAVNDWNTRAGRVFTVDVSIRDPQILMREEDTIVPSAQEVSKTEQALAWVLWALFNYSGELGLGRVEFW